MKLKKIINSNFISNNRAAQSELLAQRRAQLCDIYAHRGYHDKPQIPENSMPAFRRAIEHGFPVELDVHLIADGSLVVFHDDTLDRITGVSGRIADYDLDNLSELRLEGSEEQIPTFNEVLKLFENTRRPDGTISPLLIELKVDKGNYKKLVPAVLSRLDRYTGPFVIESFDPRAMLEVKKLRPNIVRGQLSRDFYKNPQYLKKSQVRMATNMWYNLAVKPDFIAYKFSDRDNKALRRAVDKHGVAEAGWTIKKPEQFKAARKANVCAIFEQFDPDEIDLEKNNI